MNVLGVQRTCKVNIRRLRWSTSKTTGAKTSGCRRASVRDCLVTVCEGQISLEPCVASLDSCVHRLRRQKDGPKRDQNQGRPKEKGGTKV